jgi:predicted nuclease of predicted toxin-antitoxin system
MKVLLDSCVWGGAREVIAASGHDVQWVGDWEGDPGDSAILNLAHTEGRVLVTLDKDFGELAIVKGAPHAGIIRLVGIRAREQGPVAVQVLAAHAEDLASRALLTVEADRVRVRLPGP